MRISDRSSDVCSSDLKVRDWNRTELLTHWREAWAEHVNTRLAELDIDARVDHRTLEAQGIDLEPQHKIGPAASRMAAERSEEHTSELQSLMRNSYAVFCLTKKKKQTTMPLIRNDSTPKQPNKSTA